MNKEYLMLNKEECTILKGIAILTVILSHTSGVCRLFDGVPLLGNDLVCSAFCKAGMPLFLFISGYGLHISYTEHGLKDYWHRKLLSVFLPFVIIQAITMIIYTARYGNDRGILYNVSVLLGINADNSYDPTMWYISYIFFLYFIFYMSYLIGHGSFISILSIGFISLAGFLYVPFYWGRNADYCIMTFFAGTLTARLATGKTDKADGTGTVRRNAAAGIVAALLLASTGYTLLTVFSRLNLISENLGSLMAMGAFIILVKQVHTRYSFPVLSYIGGISFPLYLLEWKLLIRSPLYDRFGINFLTYAICFMFTIMLSMLLKHIFGQLTVFIKHWRLFDQKT